MLKCDALLLFIDVVTTCKFTGLLRIMYTLIIVQNCMYVSNIDMYLYIADALLYIPGDLL